ncbi:MAG: ketoacyl-ACP synthase III [Candidatus Krumholzibacteriota bacterium]|nr:ketoacyl-ACP synthase III [Candidatus Krumholzibacteriota bacterium]
MSERIYSVITGTGSYIPSTKISNKNFLEKEFLDPSGEEYTKNNDEIIDDFGRITNIIERRYVSDDLVSSDIAYSAAKNALDSSGTDGEDLDYIILAHNFGDVKKDSQSLDIVPSLASRVKQRLGIKNPDAVAYDVVFGCPGFLQGMIQADYFIRSGDARKALVVGVETLSRISDPHDRDSMIYSDGAGAVVLEGHRSSEPAGILSHSSRTDAVKQAYYLSMGKSNRSDFEKKRLFLKMDGRSVYEYALMTVPKVVKKCIDRIGLKIEEIDKFLFHQANGKMVEAILKRVAKMYKVKSLPSSVMPMTISWLGNSSVATIPTILDLLYKGDLDDHKLRGGDTYVMASVGAGMNVNSLVYRVPDL